jgi:Uma2 family endonuclease
MSYATVPEPVRLTIDEYLAFEEASPVKHEFVGGQMFAFAGASRSHNQIVSNISFQFMSAARGTDCAVFGSDMKLRLGSKAVYYPDITVVCDPDDRHEQYVTAPCLLVEVSSPSTIGYDRREKLLQYLGIESLQGYLIVDQTYARVELHWRDEAGTWRTSEASGEGWIWLPCLDIDVSLPEIYAGTTP